MSSVVKPDGPSVGVLSDLRRAASHLRRLSLCLYSSSHTFLVPVVLIPGLPFHPDRLDRKWNTPVPGIL